MKAFIKTLVHKTLHKKYFYWTLIRTIISSFQVALRSDHLRNFTTLHPHGLSYLQESRKGVCKGIRREGRPPRIKHK